MLTEWKAVLEHSPLKGFPIHSTRKTNRRERRGKKTRQKKGRTRESDHYKSRKRSKIK